LTHGSHPLPTLKELFDEGLPPKLSGEVEKGWVWAREGGSEFGRTKLRAIVGSGEIGEKKPKLTGRDKNAIKGGYRDEAPKKKEKMTANCNWAKHCGCKEKDSEKKNL